MKARCQSLPPRGLPGQGLVFYTAGNGRDTDAEGLFPPRYFQ